MLLLMASCFYVFGNDALADIPIRAETPCRDIAARPRRMLPLSAPGALATIGTKTGSC